MLFFNYHFKVYLATLSFFSQQHYLTKCVFWEKLHGKSALAAHFKHVNKNKEKVFYDTTKHCMFQRTAHRIAADFHFLPIL